ncbi:MAG: hypothetical protein IKV73_05280, partial [Clostridia bacterium]|nr:hypothetical protein [Clostridia bacterium]
SGTVTLLSNDGTKDVDVIIVKKYSHYVVEKIDSVDLVIYDKYGKAPLELNPHGKEVDYQIFRKGSSARFKNISIGSVLSVMKSDDGEYVEIYIVASPVRGRISAVSDDGEVYIGDDGIAYRRSPDLPLSEKIEIGLDGVFYLDIEGNIISIDAAQSTHGNYCYLINAGIKAGMDSVLSFKVLNAKGDIEVLNACEKITFNGIKKTNEDILALLGGSGTITQQPLRYSKNADGELTKIEIPSKDFGTLERYYRRTTKMFGYDGVNEAFFVSPGDTVMFQVPPGGGDDDSYKVVKYDDFPVYDSKWTVTGYDLEGLTVGCTVLEVPESVQSVEITGTCCVLTEITTILNDDGDPVHKIYYMQDGKKQQKEISDKATLIHYDISISESADGYATVISPADLKPGDVFHTKTDSNGRINGIARVLSVGGTNLSNATHFLVSRGVSKEKSFGIVKKRIGTGMLLHVQGKGDYLYDITNPIGNLYMYDSRTKTASVIDAESILDVEFAPGDPAYAYVRCNSGELHDVIVFYQSK